MWDCVWGGGLSGLVCGGGGVVVVRGGCQQGPDFVPGVSSKVALERELAGTSFPRRGSWQRGGYSGAGMVDGLQLVLV